MHLNRRSILIAAGAASVALLPSRGLSAEDRLRYHLAEFQRAMQEVDPTIRRWDVDHVGGNRSLALFIFARRDPGGR